MTVFNWTDEDLFLKIDDIHFFSDGLHIWKKVENI